ncbi:MAG: AAA family ATPase, partial [Oscillospiraceae bacterium]|nr:AAA family ATPase [Oscillospiraceae bacterium]
TLANHFHPNFLVVTGDFRHKAHAGSDFTKALGYLNAIVTAFGLEKKHVYLVPGNHDVNEYDDNNRIPYISHIREDLDENPDSYTKYYDKSQKDLRNGFTEYMDFVCRFYDGKLDANDPRIKTPADVIHCIWEDKVNLILLNTALISTQKSALPQICDIKAFSNLTIDNGRPTLVLGHHGIQRMHDSHKGLMESNLNRLNVRAYLCGDSHLILKHNISRTDIPNATIPQYTCGKSASQPMDTYSDLSIIAYTCKKDGKAYVQVYKYEENYTQNKSKSFHPIDPFGTGNYREHFFMFDPTATPTSDPIDKREQVAEENERKEDAVTNYHSAYRNDWETVGREKEIKEITNLLSRGDMGKIIWVSGVAGIGKSDLCKAAARKMIGDYPGWDMPYISARDVKGYVPLIGALTKALGISLPEQQDLWYDSLLEELRRRKTQWKLPPLPTLYFDNFEDVKEDLDEVYGLLFAIRDLGYHLLFSSQTGAGRPEIRDFYLNSLDFEETENNDDFLQLDSGKLFCEIWGKTPEDEEEWTAFRTLIGELNGHPLAIVLAANMARNPMMGLSEVVNKWPTATQRARGSGDRHISLEKALRLAWNSFRGKEKEAATLYWALQFYSVLPIPDALLPYLAKACPEEKVKLGIDALCRYNLLYRDGKALTMLRPIQQQLPELLKKNGRLDPKNGVLMNALCIWAKSLTALLKDTEARGTEQYSKALELVPTLMPQVLHILEKLSQNSQHDSRLLDLAFAARNYYQYYVDSVNTLLRLSGKPIANRYPRFRAFLFESAGMLQSRLGKPEEAGRLYDEAEKLYRKEKSDLSLANTLLLKGELEFRLGKPEEAGRLYD